MLLVTMENKRKHTKKRCYFLNMNLIFERNHLEDDFEDEIIDRIFGCKFVLRIIYMYSFESGEVIRS